MTVTNVSTVDGYPRLRSDGAAIGCGARACDAVLRLLDAAEPNLPAYNLLCRYLSLLDQPGQPRAISLEVALSFRLKLALVAGFAPELASCAELRRGRAPGGLLRRLGRRRLRQLRGRILRPHRGSAPLHGRGPGEAADRGAGRRTARPAPGRARGRGDARAPRPCPTSGGGLTGGTRDGP